MTKDLKHNFSVDGIASFLKVHKYDFEWKLVVLETFYDPSEDMDWLCGNQLSCSSGGVYMFCYFV
jgi:hypothetical protein